MGSKAERGRLNDVDRGDLTLRRGERERERGRGGRRGQGETKFERLTTEVGEILGREAFGIDIDSHDRSRSVC